MLRDTKYNETVLYFFEDSKDLILQPSKVVLKLTNGVFFI